MPPIPRRGRDTALLLWLLWLYLAMIGVEAAVLASGGYGSGNEMDWSRALFTSVNAATLTGFQHVVATNEYLLPGQMTVLLLTVEGR